MSRLTDDDIFDRRVVRLNDRPEDGAGRCVIYWMQRAQRAFDNPALEFAINRANDLGKPVLAYFGLYDRYPMASARAFTFLLQGLAETAEGLAERGIGFIVRRERPDEGIARLASEFNACSVVVDEDYLNIGRSWRAAAARNLRAAIWQVDADTVVPARVTDKEEWGAYTLRPKIARVLGHCLTEPAQVAVSHIWRGETDGMDIRELDTLELACSLDTDQNVRPVRGFQGGARAARLRMEVFIRDSLPRYAEERNEIGEDVSSGISPYLHFGQISPLRVALMVEGSGAPAECVDAFLEQLIVRRELAINFCLFNHRYDSIDAAPDWAGRTLLAHRADERTELYTDEEIEAAKTGDDLWNAAQTELVSAGRIHPYLRMVWAKKLLEWSPTPEVALARAIRLNDRYALDGRDPNGYANIAWCILGKHDRPFAERPIFGKVRYMSTGATKRKTRWREYVGRVESLKQQAD